MEIDSLPTAVAHLLVLHNTAAIATASHPHWLSGYAKAAVARPSINVHSMSQYGIYSCMTHFNCDL